MALNQVSELDECFPAGYAKPEKELEVNRYLDAIEISELESDMVEIVNGELLAFRAELKEAEQALEEAKSEHKAAKSAVETTIKRVTDISDQIESGLICATLEPQSTYVAYGNGYVYYYQKLATGQLVLAKYREMTPSERNSNGNMFDNVRNQEAI